MARVTVTADLDFRRDAAAGQADAYLMRREQRERYLLSLEAKVRDPSAPVWAPPPEPWQLDAIDGIPHWLRSAHGQRRLFVRA